MMDARIEIDKGGILLKLAFLVGRTVAYHESDGYYAAKVNGVKVSEGTETELFIYTTGGVLRYGNKGLLKNTMLVMEDGSVKSLYDVAEELEVYF